MTSEDIRYLEYKDIFVDSFFIILFEVLLQIKAVFAPFFGPRNLSMAWALLYQKDFDRNFCKLKVELAFEGRFDKCLASFCFACTR